MTIDDRLRESLTDRARHVRPDGAVGWDRVRERIDHEPHGPQAIRSRLVVALVALTIALVPLVIVVVAFRSDGSSTTGATPSEHGGRIVYAGALGGNWVIHTTRPDGTGAAPIPIVDLPDDAFHPSWSPDGSRIVFDARSPGPSALEGGNRDLYVVDADGSNLVRLTSEDGWDYQPAWSPDGSRIAFVRNSPVEDIWVMDADGGAPERLTEGVAFDLSPSWSPEGTHLTFVSNRSGSPEVYTMSGDGTDVTRLTHDDGYEGDPEWSPDGERIAFAGDVDGSGLYVMKSDGTDLRRILATPQLVEATWSPDATAMAVVSRENLDTTPTLRVLDLATGSSAILVAGQELCCPSWSLVSPPTSSTDPATPHATYPSRSPEPVEAPPVMGLQLGEETKVEGWVTLANGFGVWVAGAGELFQVDPPTGASHRVATGGWDYDSVGLSDYGEGTIFLTTGSTLLELDARSGTVIDRFDLGSLGSLFDVLQAGSGVWVTASAEDGGAVLARIDLDTGAVLQRFGVGQGELVEAAGYLFTFTASDRFDGAAIVRIDPGSGDITPVPGVARGAIAAVGSHVWITSGTGVTCVDAVELTSCGDVPVTRPGLLATDGPRLWVLSLTGSRSSRLYLPDPEQPASITLIDGATGEMLAGPLALPDATPATISAFDGHAWVGFHDTGRIVRTDVCGDPCRS
jgi:WD40-like Beta Propeller Repeat